MATYIPNATQTSQPTASQTVESAALEFRTLKTFVTENTTSLDARVDALEAALPTLGQGGLPGTVYVQRFSGTGAQVAFTLSITPQSNNVVDVYINGLYQNKNTYSVAGSVLTFSEAPLAGADNIEVQITVTIALGGTDSALVNYLPGVAAPARTVQDKLREFVSVTDFGAKGDGTTDDTISFQAAINACIAGNKTLFVPNPAVEYKITAPLDITYAAAATRGLRIFGQALGAYYSNSGPIINYTGTVGYVFRILGRFVAEGGVNQGAPMSVDISGLVFKGNAACQGAILVQRAWRIRITHCSFFGFTNLLYGAIVFYASTPGTGDAFAGGATIRDNTFASGGVALLLTGNSGGVVNVVHFGENIVIDHQYGVKAQWESGVPYTANITILRNHFEGVIKSDVYSQSVAQNWLISGNYTEQNAAGENNSRFRIEGVANRGIVISGNAIFKNLSAAGTSLVYVSGGDGVTVQGNYSAYGGAADRFSVDLVSCANSRAEVMMPNGITAFPVRVNNVVFKSGLVDDRAISSMLTTSGNFVGISSGDGWPGGTVESCSNELSVTNGLARVNFTTTVTTKSAAGTSLLIGILPSPNVGQPVYFPVYTVNVTGTKPFYGVLGSGATTATVYDATGAAVNYQTAVSVGSTVTARFDYLTQG